MAGANQSRALAAGQKLGGLLGKQSNAFLQAAQEAGEDLRNEIIRELSKSKSPSAPGSPPGVVTGTLRNSIYMNVHSSGAKSALIEVGTRVKYATYLEFGTRRMAPRPFMRTAIARATPRINAKVVARIRSVMP
jgi:HK97 gp10 family phage protein